MGMLVKIKSGKGRIVGELPSKIFVELMNDDFSVKLKDGKPHRVMASKSSAVLIGFIDGGMEVNEEYLGAINIVNVTKKTDTELGRISQASDQNKNENE